MALTRNTKILSSDITNVRSVVVAVARRVGSDISGEATYPVGGLINRAPVTNLQTHLKNLGHQCSYTLTAGNKA